MLRPAAQGVRIAAVRFTKVRLGFAAAADGRTRVCEVGTTRKKATYVRCMWIPFYLSFPSLFSCSCFMLRHVFSRWSEPVTMDRVLPRSPQNGVCANGPACTTSTSTTATVATLDPIEDPNGVPLTTALWSASYPTPSPPQEAPGSNVGPVTSASIIYNNDGSRSWTSLTTIYPTTVLTTTIPDSSALPTPTAPPVVTLPPEAQSVSAVNGNSSDSGLSKGAVAGLAIGTTLLGAAIAFLTAWLLFKRRDRGFERPSSSPLYTDSSPELGMLQKPAAAEHAATTPYVRVAAITPLRKPIPSSGDALAAILPPSPSEHQVQSRLAALFGAMHTHIDTFYRDVHASVTPSMAADLALFGKDVDMPALLQGCSRPTAALKHALVAFVMERTAPPDDPSSSSRSDTSLWPADLTHALTLHTPTLTPTSPSSNLAAALALHRRLTIHLYTSLHSPSPRGLTLNSNHSTPSLPLIPASAIRAAAEHFSLTFFPWLDPSLDDSEREADLAEILSSALQCRMWLLGLEGAWGFEWQESGSGVVVVRPAVVVRGEGEEGGRGREVLGQSVLAV